MNASNTPVLDWLSYAQNCLDAFRLECSDEDIKQNDYAKEVHKTLIKQYRYALNIDRLIKKLWNGDKEMWWWIS